MGEIKGVIKASRELARVSKNAFGFGHRWIGLHFPVWDWIEILGFRLNGGKGFTGFDTRSNRIAYRLHGFSQVPMLGCMLRRLHVVSDFCPSSQGR